MKNQWSKIKCDNCNGELVVHADWKNPPNTCDVCRLIEGDIESAIEIILLKKTLDIRSNIISEIKTIWSEYHKDLDLSKLPSDIYNQIINDHFKKERQEPPFVNQQTLPDFIKKRSKRIMAQKVAALVSLLI